MSLKQKILLALILLLATGLRLAAIFHYGSFLWDEIFSFTFAQKPWGEAIKWWLMETNPPLHLAFLKIWLAAFPANEFFARLPSAIFGLLGVWTIFSATKKIFNQRVALLAAALLALCPYHIFMSATARGYSLLMLLDILTVFYFYKIFFCGEKTRGNFIVLALANLGLLFTHLTAAFIIAGQLLALIYKRGQFWLWLKINAASLALAATWLGFSLFSKLNLNLLTTGWYFLLDQGPADIVRALLPLFYGPGWPIPFWLMPTLFILAVSWIFWQQKKSGATDKKFIALLLMAFLPALAAGFFGLWNIKFFMVSLPWAVLVLAYILDALFKKFWLAILAAVLLALPGLLYLYLLMPINDWNGINQYLAKNYSAGKKQIFIYNLFIDRFLTERYLNAPMPVLPYFPCQNCDYEREIVLKNYLRYQHPAEEIQGWLKRVNLKKFDEIFLLEEKAGIDLSEYLAADGWKKIDEFNVRLLDRKKLFYYARD